MLTHDGCLQRRKRLWDAVPESLEWLLVADPRHVLYLCNFHVNPFSFSAGERGLLLLERDAGATLIVDNFALRSASAEPFVDREVVEDWYDHKRSVINRDHALLCSLETLADRLYGREGAVEAEWLPLGAWEVLGLDRETHSVSEEPDSSRRPGRGVDLGTILRELRRQKLPDEIELLRRCMRATEAGHARAREIVRPGVSEFEVYRAVADAAQEAAGQPAVVYGDFRAVNAAVPRAGGLPTQRRLEPGDMFILDFSVVIHGYRSDFTNTMAVGQPTDEQTMLFELCQSAMQQGEAAFRAGAGARDVYAAVAEVFRESGFADAFPHHAGHGIGLAHPEAPILVPASEDTLLEGDVVTLEPGLYVQGTGGVRIEHNYLITADGAERLSDHYLGLT